MKKRILSLCLVAILTLSFFVGAIPPAKATGEISAKTFYYDQLNERQKWCYTYIKNFLDTHTPGSYQISMADQLNGNFSNSAINSLVNDLSVGQAALFSDNPMYELKGGYHQAAWNVDYLLITIDCYAFPSSYMKQKLEARITQIVNTVGTGGDRYTRLHKLAEYLMDHMFYDPYIDQINHSGSFLPDQRGLIYDSSVLGLLDNIAICSGYMDIVKVLCDRLDIPCISVGNNGHAWNYVQMEDGNWYELDMTNACRWSWEGSCVDKEYYFSQVFLKDTGSFSTGGPLYLINVDGQYYCNAYPQIPDAGYTYTGSTTDFSYAEASLNFQEGSPRFVYEVNFDGTTCTITDYAGPRSGTLTIPSTIDGYTVTAIGAYAFYYCKEFTGVTIPDTVQSIGNAAFAGCYGLTSVSLSAKLHTIGEGVFIGCKALSSITLPDLVVEIPANAFYDCVSLQTISTGTHVQSVAPNAFTGIAQNATISGPANSAIQTYANTNGIPFQVNGTLCAMTDADGDWEFDRDGHFHSCLHGAPFDRTPHTGGSPHCSGYPKCDVCGGEYGVMAPIVHLEFVNAGNGYLPTCSTEGYEGDYVCANCGAFDRRGFNTPATGIHIPKDDTWYSDDTWHWQVCSCGQQLNKAPHYGETVQNGMATCEYCNHEYPVQTQDPGHTCDPIEDVWYGDTGSHWLTCQCGKRFSSGAHTGDTTPESPLATCEVCGLTYPRKETTNPPTGDSDTPPAGDSNTPPAGDSETPPAGDTNTPPADNTPGATPENQEPDPVEDPFPWEILLVVGLCIILVAAGIGVFFFLKKKKG